jgi:acetyltransferase-like isoleucine patch superfamily enzyme
MLNFLTVLKLRFSGVSIHAHVKLKNAQSIVIGHGSLIDERVELVGNPETKGSLSVGADTVVRSGTYISARRGRIEVGANSYIGHGCWIGGQGTTVIGEYFLCAPKVVIISSNHDFANQSLPYRDQGEITSVILIGRNVWIGANSVILPGAIIGDAAVVGAGSVVRGVVAPGSTVAGVPAREIHSAEVSRREESSLD